MENPFNTNDIGIEFYIRLNRVFEVIFHSHDIRVDSPICTELPN